MELAGSVALVSGGSGGLGAEICRQLAGNGASVIVGYRNGAERADAVCQSLLDGGHKSKAIPLDHTDTVSIKDCINAISADFGALDILINNAGMASGGHKLPAGDLEAFTPDIWSQMLEVNMSGPYYLTRAAAPHLRASDWGRVVNLSSTIGHGTWGAAAAYAPSKAAVVPLTRFLAAALAPDVTVNCVSPGLMEGTQMSGSAPEAYIAGWRDRSLLKSTTLIEDVARQVLLFCKSPSVTGQTAIVDGGIHFD